MTMKITVKGVHTVKARGGVYRYAWRGGPRLSAEPGTDTFLDELAAARATRLAGDRSKLSGLCAAYRASTAWTGLSDKTRQNWTPWLDRIQAKFGDAPLKAFDSPKAVPAIRKWLDTFAATPRSADVALQVFSRLLTFGAEEALVIENPCAKIRSIYRNDRSAIIWTADDLAALEAAASPEVMHAARLAALTGLRQADLLRLAWSHVGPLAIEIATGKSSGRKTTLIPIHAELRAALDQVPKRSTLVLTNTDGQPWKTGFGASWQAAKTRAGVDKHFHDLRGTAATKLYLAGFSFREIAEIMTWSEAAVEALINRYVKRDELLKDRIRRLDEQARANAKRTKTVKHAVKHSASNTGSTS